MASILRQTTVTRDGYHNAFTDLLFWQDCYWVSYRKGSEHISADGRCVLSVSVDRSRFEVATQLKVAGDCRDPKLVPMADGRLAMYFPAWMGGHKHRHLQNFVAFSQDGFSWETPVPVMQPHWWLWRVVSFEGRYYGAAYTYRDRQTGADRVYSTDFVVSDDMIHWEVLSTIGDKQLGEAGFHFWPDGEVWMVSRCVGTPYSYFCSSEPPYKSWDIQSLETVIHSPAMIEVDGQLYVAGRRDAAREGDTTYPFHVKTLLGGDYSMGVWRVGRGSVEPVLRIPATGDCAYPGFIRDPEGRTCLTYYSQHAYHMGVLDQPFRHDPHTVGETIGLRTPTDVYFAELALP